jgi:hypothetical protein
MERVPRGWSTVEKSSFYEPNLIKVLGVEEQFCKISDSLLNVEITQTM